MAPKVNFNTSVKEIEVTLAPDGDGKILLDVRADLYSAGKIDWLNTTALRSFEFPIVAVGGVVFSGGKQGALFIMRTPWKLRLYDADHELGLEGVFATEDGSRVWLAPNGGTPRVVAVLPNTPYDVVTTIPPSAADIASASSQATWNAATSAHKAGGTFGKTVQRIKASVIWSGDVISATLNTITLNTDASAVDGAYDPAEITIIEDGSGVGQSRNILQYDGATRTAVVDRNWKNIPAGGSIAAVNTDAGREHVNEGLVQSATATTITLNTSASPFDDAYEGQVIFIRSGVAEDQARRVVAYNGTTKVAVVSKVWDVNPDATSAYVMLPSGVWTSSDLRSAIYEAPAADYSTDGTMGGLFNQVLSFILSILGRLRS